MTEAQLAISQHLWRISNHPGLDGLGGERADGRWHTMARGKRIVYLAESAAVALHENLVHFRNATDIPDGYQLLKIVPQREILAHFIEESDLPGNWREGLQSTQTIGDVWLARRVSALLRVPSAPSPESWNYLLNPLHPDAGALQIEWARTLTYDKRLFHLSG